MKEIGIFDFLTDEEVRQLKGNETHKMCLYREGSGNHCENLFMHLRKAGYQPPLESSVNCFVFDQEAIGSSCLHESSVTARLKRLLSET